MFLIRTAFWLSLVVLVLPTDAQQQQKLYATASSAATQAATFCDRNRAICTQGAQYWAKFQKKLEFGTRMAIDLVSERITGNRPQQSAVLPVENTLSREDLQPAWRRQPGRAGI